MEKVDFRGSSLITWIFSKTLFLSSHEDVLSSLLSISIFFLVLLWHVLFFFASQSEDSEECSWKQAHEGLLDRDFVCTRPLLLTKPIPLKDHFVHRLGRDRTVHRSKREREKERGSDWVLLYSLLVNCFAFSLNENESRKEREREREYSFGFLVNINKFNREFIYCCPVCL